MKESMKRTAGPLVKAHSKGIEVHVERHVKDKMEGWCNAAHSEVSGFFKVKLEDGVFYVYDVFLPKQMGSSGYTKIDNGQSSLLNYFKKITINKDNHWDFEKYTELTQDLKGWWHTHYNGSVFWSGTDDDEAQQLVELTGDWGLSIVINQAGHWLARVDVVSPVPVMIDELPITFVPNKKKHAKRDYQWDVNRWVSPFPKPAYVKKAVWSSDKITVAEEPKETKYINVGGTVMPMEVFKEILECPCGDMTCVDCSDSIKKYSKGVLYA